MSAAASPRTKAPLRVVVPVIVALPVTFKSLPTYSFLAILAPPSVRNAPVSPVASVASVARVISTMPENVPLVPAIVPPTSAVDPVTVVPVIAALLLIVPKLVLI